MTETNYILLKESIDNLVEQYELYKGMESQNFDEAVQKAVTNSVIKCFELCFDTLAKHLKRYLEEVVGVAEVKNISYVILETAKDTETISEEEYDTLSKYRKTRNQSTHNYAEEEIANVFDILEGFIRDALEFHEKFNGKK